MSAAFYLRRQGLLSLDGIRSKWRYLSVLYGTTLAVNLLLFNVVFPAMANSVPVVSAAPAAANVAAAAAPAVGDSTVKLVVDIPCAGHAPLIVSELKRDAGVKGVTFKAPNIFTVLYDGGRTSVGRITSLEVFKSYPAKVISN